MKKSVVWLCCLVLTLGFAMPALAVGVLPDPGQYFSKEGKLDQRGVDIGGIQYDVYCYKNIGTFSLSSYLDDALIAQGFTWNKAKSESVASDFLNIWYALTYQEKTAYLKAFCSVINPNSFYPTYLYIDLTLYVPNGMAFDFPTNTPSPDDNFFDNLNSSVTPTGNSSFDSPIMPPSLINSIFDDPSFSDLVSNSPVSRVTCSSCHGTRKCDICGGDRKYRNPYTGSWLDCSCDDGKCSVCDGKGYW